MATPLREDSQATTLVKSSCLLSTSLSLSFFHTHASTFPFFHCQPFLFCLPPLLFPSSPIVLLLLSLHHPWHTSLPVSLHYYATFSSFHLQAPTSQVNVNMSSHFSKAHCIYSWLMFGHNPYIHTYGYLTVSRSACLPSRTHSSRHRFVIEPPPFFVLSPIKGEIYRGNQTEGSLRGQL